MANKQNDSRYLQLIKIIIVSLLSIYITFGCASKNIKTASKGACEVEKQARLQFPLVIHENLGDLVEFHEYGMVDYLDEYMFLFEGINNYKHEDFHWAVRVNKETCEASFLPNKHVKGHLKDIFIHPDSVRNVIENTPSNINQAKANSEKTQKTNKTHFYRNEIESLAKEIFRTETGKTKEVDAFCFKDRRINEPHATWICSITEQGETTPDGKYRPLPIDTGNWLLLFDFIKGTYELRSL
jgi:hypothetical protein